MIGHCIYAQISLGVMDLPQRVRSQSRECRTVKPPRRNLSQRQQKPHIENSGSKTLIPATYSKQAQRKDETARESRDDCL
jgi:hypothetical protein